MSCPAPTRKDALRLAKVKASLPAIMGYLEGAGTLGDIMDQVEDTPEVVPWLHLVVAITVSEGALSDWIKSLRRLADTITRTSSSRSVRLGHPLSVMSVCSSLTSVVHGLDAYLLPLQARLHLFRTLLRTLLHVVSPSHRARVEPHFPPSSIFLTASAMLRLTNVFSVTPDQGRDHRIRSWKEEGAPAAMFSYLEAIAPTIVEDPTLLPFHIDAVLMVLLACDHTTKQIPYIILSLVPDEYLKNPAKPAKTFSDLDLDKLQTFPTRESTPTVLCCVGCGQLDEKALKGSRVASQRFSHCS